MSGSKYSSVLSVVIAGSMMFGSTAAVAASNPPPAIAQISPWAALSAMSGGVPAAALCGAAAAAAAAGQAAASGCVFPALDTPPPIAQAAPPQPIPVPPVEGPGAGMAFDPLLLALGALAAGALIYFLVRNKNNNSNSPA